MRLFNHRRYQNSSADRWQGCCPIEQVCRHRVPAPECGLPRYMLYLLLLQDDTWEFIEKLEGVYKSSIKTYIMPLIQFLFNHYSRSQDLPSDFCRTHCFHIQLTQLTAASASRHLISSHVFSQHRLLRHVQVSTALSI